MSLIRVRADLHLHTCLSPCGDYAASPSAMVAAAAAAGLGLVAITDHNSAENLAACLEAARRLGPGAPAILCGLEVTSAEEAHLVCLLPDLTAALVLQGMVFDHLQAGVNDAEVFGHQIVANADDEVEYLNEKLLIGATDLGASELARRVHDLGGLILAAHVDREAYSLVGQLGMIPPELPLDGVEISRLNDPARAGEWLLGRELAAVTGSDAHHPDDVGRVWTELTLAGAGLEELALALRGEAGRGVAGWGRREA